jgi:hypothetical protein
MPLDHASIAEFKRLIEKSTAQPVTDSEAAAMARRVVDLALLVFKSSASASSHSEKKEEKPPRSFSALPSWQRPARNKSGPRPRGRKFQA